ncbi:MAG: FtsW/RodA/SpoVE family cell cycle protein [Thermoleophilaceae bacterium]|nr:FtsW/RodA/SpoVE family cell cycle protein [Thermoleophilaceae bacterium]
MARKGDRWRELFGLIPVSLLVTAGFTAVLINRSANDAPTITYGVFFLGCCVLGSLVIRWRLPAADPWLFPLSALLAGFGLVTLYRLDEKFAAEQALYFLVGLGLMLATILWLRDIRALERYRYTIAAIGIGLLVLPRMPGIGAQVNGAFLAINLGFIQFQPAEFAKIAIVVFLASYLNDTRDVLVRGRIPQISLKHMGPLLVIWGASMLMLVFIRDLGSSLMFFGGFLAVLYVATSRISLVLVGLVMFFGGAAFFASNVGHVEDRVQTWLDPFSTERVLCPGTGTTEKYVDCQGFQIAQSLFAQADGGLFGQGFGNALIKVPGGGPLLPAAETDLIYAVITDELGLFGATGVILIYLMFAWRGFRAAIDATDGFSKLLAAGLTSVFCLQVFVIVGGVTRVIPLTGVTLPFISAGGSSILANFVLLALILIVSDRARRDRGDVQGGLV